MKLEKLVLNEKGFPDLFAQWAEKDGAARAERVAARMRSISPVVSGDYRDNVTVVRDEHATRPAFHIGSTVDYAAVVEADHGTASRALDAAR